MHLSKFATLASLIIAATSAGINFNCSSAATVFVTVTATPLTEKFSILSGLLPFNSSRPIVPPKPELAIDTLANTTAISKDHITLVHLVTSAPIPATADKGPYFFTADNGTTVWLGGKSPPTGVSYINSTVTIAIQSVPPTSSILSGGTSQPTSYSVVFLTVVNRVYETVTITKTASTGTTSRAITTSSFASISSSGTEPLPSAVRSAPTAPLIAPTPPKRFVGFGPNGWNATFRTQLPAGSANEPVKQFSQPTAIDEKLVVRPGIGSLLVAPSSLENTPSDAGVRRFGSTAAATFENVIVSGTKTFDGTAMTTPATVLTPTNAALHDPVVTCKFDLKLHVLVKILIPSLAAKKNAAPVYPWDLESGSE
ncbi:hypothetical protein MMC07_008921 [Pseudocyphellaria aurata]|nr:hypothetical protein [Pseudocyphellaria aurata]